MHIQATQVSAINQGAISFALTWVKLLLRRLQMLLLFLFQRTARAHRWSLQAEGSDEPPAPDPDPIPAPGPVPPAAAAATLSRRNELHENSGPPLPWDSRAAEHSVLLEEEDEEVEEVEVVAAATAGVGAAPLSGLIP